MSSNSAVRGLVNCNGEPFLHLSPLLQTWPHKQFNCWSTTDLRKTNVVMGKYPLPFNRIHWKTNRGITQAQPEPASLQTLFCTLILLEGRFTLIKGFCFFTNSYHKTQKQNKKSSSSRVTGQKGLMGLIDKWNVIKSITVLVFYL